MAIKISGNTVIDDSRNITSSGTMSANAYIGDGSQLTNLPGGGNVLEATASGTLADGSKVIVNADGTVSVVNQTFSETTTSGLGTPEVFHSITTYYASATFDSTNNRVVITYQGGGYGRAVVGQISGASISFGTPVVFKSDSTTDISATFDSSNGKIVVVYRDSGNSGRGTARVGTVSGTSISFGSESIFRYADSTTMSATFDSTNNKVVIAFRDQGNGGVGTAVVGTVSGTSISFGSYTAFESTQTERISATFDSSNGKVVIAYNDSINQKGEAVVGTVSGTSISFGSSVQYNSSDSGFVSAVYDSANQKIVIAYRDAGNSRYGTAIVGTVSGTSISFGSEVLFKSGRADEISATYDSTNGKVVITYSNPGNSDYGTLVVGTVSGTSISFDSETVFESATTYFIGATFDSSNGKVVIAYSDYGNSYYGTAIVFGNTGFPIPQVGSATVFESANISYPTATFDSTNNKVVIAYEDNGNSQHGTAIVGTVSGTSISFGSPSVFNAANTDHIRATFDSSNGKVVIGYRDVGDSFYGKAIVGTVSGTSISFGTEVSFSGSVSVDYISPVYDSTNQKVVIAYRDGSSTAGTAIVGTVSGTSISFGTPVVFDSGNSSYILTTFDSTNNKVVIAYQDEDNSWYGTAVVGTVSGTSISFGTPVVFEYAAAGNPSPTFDSSSGKVVIVYYDGGNSYYGTAVVGTVSGTSISFGTPVVYNTANTFASMATYDSTNQKVVISYYDAGNNSYGTAIAGTVSGTSISFDSPVVFESASTGYIAPTFDSSNGKVVIAYQDNGNSTYGTAVVFSPSTMVASTNLTSENFIGISDASYTNGQTATIQLAGSVDDAQSGLTPGSKYYVQNDGTLSTSVGSPSVFAGTAVASTKLIVKN